MPSIPPPSTGLRNAEQIAADHAAQWQALPGEIRGCLQPLPDYARQVLAERINSYRQLDAGTVAIARFAKLGQILGRAGAALERDEITGEQFRTLRDYVERLHD